jgi:hypothetical protein
METSGAGAGAERGEEGGIGMAAFFGAALAACRAGVALAEIYGGVRVPWRCNGVCYSAAGLPAKSAARPAVALPVQNG